MKSRVPQKRKRRKGKGGPQGKGEGKKKVISAKEGERRKIDLPNIGGKRKEVSPRKPAF